MNLTWTRQHERARNHDGFTLIELMVVIVIMAMIAAISLPYLLPTIIYSTHEGAARHLANYGRSAIAHATLDKETITVMIDLDNQEYWSERLPEPAPEEEEAENEFFESSSASSGGARASSAYSGRTRATSARSGGTRATSSSPGGTRTTSASSGSGRIRATFALNSRRILRGSSRSLDSDSRFPEDDMELYRMATEELQLPEDERRSEEGEELLNEQTSRMATQFNAHARQALTARAERVVHDRQGILEDVGDLFEEEFRLDEHGEEILPEEVRDPLLARTRVPEGVYIEYVQLGDLQYIEGVVEIELTPLGLGSDVEFSLINEDGDVFVVTWDPVSGSATLTEGRTTER